MNLSIIIVSYKVKYFLEQCLYSVQRAIENLQAEVWVVDNASLDGSVQYLRSRFPWANFISNQTNVGFAKANNQVLQNCSGKYILYLNPDTIISEDCILKTLSFLEANQRAGAVGVRMIDGSGTFLPESKRSFPTPATSFYKLSGLCKLFSASKTFGKYSLAYLDEFKNHEVDVLSGAFMLVRLDLAKQLKGFDEAFFMYGEDIDFSYRIQKMGYKNYYFGESTIIHFKGESTRKQNLNYVRTFYKAMSIFVKKHYSGFFASILIFLISLAVRVKIVQSIFKRCRWKFHSLLLDKLVLFRHINKFCAERQKRTLVIGTDKEYAEVKKLFTTAGLKERKMLHLRVSEISNKEVCNSLYLCGEIEATQAKEVIFCFADISYGNAISVISGLRKNISIKFYGTAMQTIVSSDSKNSPGKCISMKDNVAINTAFKIPDFKIKQKNYKLLTR